MLDFFVAFFLFALTEGFELMVWMAGMLVFCFWGLLF